MAKITTKDLYEMVVNGEELTEDAINKAQELLNTLNAQNAKRKEVQSAKQTANDAIKAKILAFMAEKNDSVMASEIAGKVGISTQKASALLLQMKNDGAITNGEKFKRTVTYILPAEDSEGEDSEDDIQEDTET